jgi:hypothetical protein
MDTDIDKGMACAWAWAWTWMDMGMDMNLLKTIRLMEKSSVMIVSDCMPDL